MFLKMTKSYRYPGIRPFSREDTGLFFGRSKEIEELHQLILARPYIVLFAKSGIGKTSLLNAGVLPKLEEQGYQISKLRFQKGENTQAPTEAFQQLIKAEIKSWKAEDRFEQILEVMNSSKAPSLWEYLKAYSILLEEKDPNTGQPPVFVFDQFEEFFLHEEEHRKLFIEMLADTLYQRIPEQVKKKIQKTAPRKRSALEKFCLGPINCKIVMAIRSDRLSLLDNLSTEIPAILDNRYQLYPLNKDNAREAITKPAGLVDPKFISAPFQFSEESQQAIFKSLSDEQGQIESFQLQIICEYIEQKSLHLKRPLTIENNFLIEFSDKEKANTGEDPVQIALRHITKSYYERHIQDLGDAKIQEKARIFIEDGLMIGGGRVSLPQKAASDKYDISEELLNEILNSRIIRIEETHLGKAYEIAHDALVDPIAEAKAKREAIAEKKRIKAEAIEQERKLEEERRKRRIITVVAIVAIVMVLVAIIASAWAWVAQKNVFNTKLELIESKGEVGEAKSTIRKKNDSLKLANETLETEQQKKQQIIDAFYFFKGNYALAYKGGNYGFINKEGEVVIDYKYKELKPFDPIIELAEAKVAQGNQLKKLYLDTLGNEYYFDNETSSDENTPPTQVLDLSGKKGVDLKRIIKDYPDLVSLSLRGTDLEEVPQEIGKLKKLRLLDLSDNFIQSIPESIGQLKELRVLELNNTQIYKLPQSLTKIKALKILGLEHTSLNQLPKNIGNLTNLEQLTLGLLQHKIEKLPRSIGQLVNLKILQLNWGLIKEIPPSVGQLQYITELDMREREGPKFRVLIEQLPKGIGNWTQVKLLNLGGNYALRTLPPTIGNMKSLETLVLIGCENLKTVPESIKNLTQLKTLYIGESGIDEKEEKRIRKLLPNCKISREYQKQWIF